MPLAPLDNLVKARSLKAEAPDQAEFDGLVSAGKAKLADAARLELSPESRFDLAYNAAHALALAALRWHGYRAENNRYIVFQALAHTVGLATEKWRVLDAAHKKRNLAEYQGTTDVDEKMLEALIRVAGDVQTAVIAFGPIPLKS